MNRREVLTAMAVGGIATTATADEPKNPDAAHLAFVEECANDIRKLARTLKTRAELLDSRCRLRSSPCHLHFERPPVMPGMDRGSAPVRRLGGPVVGPLLYDE